MKKYILATVILMLTAVSYSQMIYDFKAGKLRDDQSTKKKAKVETRIAAGEIHLKSGEVLEGNFKIPEKNPVYGTAIKITCFPSKEKRSIKGEDINMVKIFSTSSTKAHTFIYSQVSRVKLNSLSYKKLGEKSFSEQDFKHYDKGIWMMQLEKGKVSLYVSGIGYMFHNDGSMVPYTKGDRMSTPVFSYFGKLEDRDEFPIFLHETGRQATAVVFRATAPAFFEGHPIADKIQNKEEGYYKKGEINIVDICKEYNKNN